MLLEAGGFETLVGRFARLGKADRQAILARLDPAARAEVTSAVAQRGAPRRDNPAMGPRAGQEYAAYSPWLGDIVRDAAANVEEGTVITDHARRAIVDAHQAMTASGDVAADSLLHQLRRFGSRLFDSAARHPS